MNASPVRIGFVSFAHMHAYSYASSLKRLPGIRIAGITDPDSTRGKRMAGEFRAPYFKRPSELFREGVDGVIICSENARHTSDVLEAARAGVHVMVEKPIATTIADATRQIAACHKAGVSLQLAFPMRFSAPVREARRSVLGGSIGRILAANTTNHGRMPGGWFTIPRLSGGGAAMDHTVHVADLLRWFLADEVEEVYAETGKLIHPKLACDDCALLSMRFKKGAIATLDASWSRVAGFPTWGDVTMRLWGGSGTLSVDAFAQHLTVFADRPSYEDWGDSADLALVQEFVTGIRERRPPSPAGEDGLRALEVALAAYRSARTHKPVRISSIS